MLEYAGHRLIGFDDHSYRWVSVKRFVWDGRGDDRDVLAASVGDRHYRDSYLALDSDEQDSGDVHGPYRVAALGPGSFEPVTPGQAAGVVEEFCRLHDSPPAPVVRRAIEAEVLSRFPDASCYQLPPRPEAEHDWNFILMEFREVVVLSRKAGEALLVVMAID
ncbi:MAG: hypothetical protein K2X87_05055 [Gemmataceae bacterium]|nr:hypothetical protein [Gemmataceae bacterium]